MKKLPDQKRKREPPPVERRIHPADRRSAVREELDDIRAQILQTINELDQIKMRLELNAKNLEIQFARMAQMQVELDQLTGQPPPRFKG